MDNDKKFGSEEALHARLRALTAEVGKLRRELELTLRASKKPAERDVALDRSREKLRQWTGK